MASGKISSIKKEYSHNNGSLEASLSQNGFSRFPGTGVRFVPYKEPNGDYRTGLNPDALYVKKMPEEQRKIEVERINSLRKRLQESLGIDLGPRAAYYTEIFNDNVKYKAEIVRLKEGDNIFNLSDDWKVITYEWLRVHPLIASSYQSYERGEYPSSTQFFVNDENIEEELKYKKETLVNRALSIMEGLSLEKRKKAARLIGLPISDSSKEMTVYNLLSTFLKSTEIKSGDFKGSNPIDLFMKVASMDDKLITVKDLVEQAIRHSIYRVTKGRRITEGGQEIAKDKEELIEMLMDNKNQDDLLVLQDKLKIKKSLAI